MTFYEMPVVVAGQAIMWHSDGDKNTPPIPGFVTFAGTRAINLSLIDRDRVGLVPKDGVKHVSDPSLKDRKDEAGGWDYHPIDLAIRQELDSLRRMLEDLTGGTGKKAKVA